MAKYDRNGVKHDGWAAVGKANRERQGHCGKQCDEYEAMANNQGVNLSRTLYRKCGK